MTNSTPNPKDNRNISEESEDQSQEEVVEDLEVIEPEEVEQFDHQIQELSQLDNKLDELSTYLDQIEKNNEILQQQINVFLNEIKGDNDCDNSSNKL